jgi:transposase-like protein
LIELQPDVFVSKERDLEAAMAFFANEIRSHCEPAEITTDRAHTLVRVVTDLLPAALDDTPPGTPTTESKLTTVASRPDCDRCEA